MNKTKKICLILAMAAFCAIAVAAMNHSGGSMAQKASGFIQEYKYIAIFMILFLCGIGLPIPEEITLITSGYISDPQLFGSNSANIWLAITACIVGILAGDTMTYLAGRLWGMQLLKSRLVRLLISENKLHKADVNFHKYGWRMVFYARFFAGLRMAVYFFTGSMKKSMWKFLFLDLLGALLSVPLSVFIGFAFSTHIDGAFAYIAKAKHDLLLVGFTALLVIVLLWISFRKREKSVQQPAGQEPAEKP